MTTLQTIETRVRAIRRVSSLPLMVIGVATIAAGLSPIAGDLEPVVGIFIPPMTALALWVAMKVTATRAGLGMGRERYGMFAIVIVAASTITLVPLLLGPAFLLGVLLFAVGWRAEDQRQWISGLTLALASPLLNYFFVDNLFAEIYLATSGSYWRTELPIDDLVLGAYGLLLMILGSMQFPHETKATRRRSE